MGINHKVSWMVVLAGLLLAGLGIGPGIGTVWAEEDLPLGVLKDLCLGCGRGQPRLGDLEATAPSPSLPRKTLQLDLGLSPEEIRAMENPDQPSHPPRGGLR